MKKNKLTWEKKIFILSIIVILVFFPTTNGYIAIGIDILLTQMGLIGMYFYVPALIIATIIATYRVFIPQKLNIPKKTKKSKVNIKDYQEV